MKRWLLFALVVVLLGSCGPTPKPTRRIRLGASGNVTPLMGFTLSTSTSCAQVGESITFTLTLYNREGTPLTLVTSPTLDIVLIRETNPPILVTQWSASSGYPRALSPLKPQEIRPYTWTWVPTEEVGSLDVVVQISVRDEAGKLWTFDQPIEKTGVGEADAHLGGGYSITRCVDMESGR